MFDRLVRYLAEKFGSDDEDGDSGGFAGSMLDRSIDYSHGVDDSEAASEIAQIQERAEVLDEQERYRN